MKRHNISSTIVALMLLFSSVQAVGSPTLDTKAIEQAIGKPGELKDDVYKVSLPRKDLSVSLNDVQLKPGFALGTWLAFKQAGHDAVLDGDLVLTEHEVGAVFGQLRKGGIQVSALDPPPSVRPPFKFPHADKLIGTTVQVSGAGGRYPSALCGRCVLY